MSATDFNKINAVPSDDPKTFFESEKLNFGTNSNYRTSGRESGDGCHAIDVCVQSVSSKCCSSDVFFGNSGSCDIVSAELIKTFHKNVSKRIWFRNPDFTLTLILRGNRLSYFSFAENLNINLSPKG